MVKVSKKVIKQENTEVKKKKTDTLEQEVKKAAGVMRGRVVSAKVPQTVTVLIERRKMHHLYQKAFTSSKKYLVHDNLGVSLGDVVDIVKSKPISKNKHFKILRVVGRDIEAVVSEQLKEEAAEAIAEVMPEEKEEEPSETSRSPREEKPEKSRKRKEKSPKLKAGD